MVMGIHMHDNYKKANNAPRCVHIRPNGPTCTQPALRDRHFCRFHDPIAELTRRCPIPFVEDAPTLQVAYTEVVSALLDSRIDTKAAELCFQGLRLAALNLKQLQEEMNSVIEGNH